MKLFVSIGLLFFVCVPGKAQIALEHVYPNASLSSTSKELMLTPIDSGEFKYLYVNYSVGEFVLYNLDHSIYETVDIPATSGIYRIMYITRRLFDCDSSNIEFLLNQGDGVNSGYVKIFRTDGTVLFHGPDLQAVNAFGTAAVFRSPIVTTPFGTRMLLDNLDNGEVNVYTLCGFLPIGFYPDADSDSYSKVIPNPSRHAAKIEFSLPTGIHTAVLLIADLSGREVKRYNVDDTFGFVMVEEGALPPGAYTYEIMHQGQKLSDGKMIRIH